MNFKAVGGRCITYSSAGSTPMHSAKLYIAVNISLMPLLFFDPSGVSHSSETGSKLALVNQFGGT
jgi:hypothetical protein